LKRALCAFFFEKLFLKIKKSLLIGLSVSFLFDKNHHGDADVDEKGDEKGDAPPKLEEAAVAEFFVIKEVEHEED
jgi:hypothetical protein